MRVLITNDDGIESPGIRELARHIEGAGYEVIVIAPDHDASGTGASLGRVGSGNPIAVTRTSIEVIDRTPRLSALCVSVTRTSIELLVADGFQRFAYP